VDIVGNFVFSENRFPNPGSVATAGDINLAQRGGLRHLLAHFKSSELQTEGCFEAPVSSRVLESALTLHLLRRTGREPVWQHRLERYLCARVEGADVLSSLAARAVLNLPSGLDAPVAVRLFASGAEYALQRKRALLTMLLVELGVIPFHQSGLFPDDYATGAVHRFSRLYASALRLLHHRYQPPGIDTTEDLAFLAGAQAANGSWEQQVLITLFAMLALGTGHPAFERGFTYLQSVSREDGGLPFIDNQNTWVSCIAGLALHSLGWRSGSNVQDRLAQFIVNRQHQNGGWSFADGVVQTDTDVSANCAQLLLQQDSVRYAETIERVLEYLGGLQRADGGYPTYEREGESEVTMTANILLAQCLAAARNPALSSKMRQAAAYLACRQRPDGSFEMSWSRSETYSMFRVLWALDVYRQTEPAPQEPSISRRALNRLVQTQHLDGGWGQGPRLTSDALSTAYAVSALCLLCKRHFVEPHRIHRAIDYLLSQQDQQTGAFHSIPDVAGPRPIPFDTPLLSTIWCLLALSFVQSSNFPLNGKESHHRE
jgi:squalene-hopene/tetraprenyl-beta-curcumene cyclase